MNLADIDNALVKQRRTIQNLNGNLERAESARDIDRAAVLRRDLAMAQRVLIRLDQIRRQETPVDARSERISSGSAFFGGSL